MADRNRFQKVPGSFEDWCAKGPIQKHGWFLTTNNEREALLQIAYTAYQHGIAEGQKELIAKNKKLLEDSEAFVILDEEDGEDSIQVVPDVTDITEEDIEAVVDEISEVPEEEYPPVEEKKFNDWNDF